MSVSSVRENWWVTINSFFHQEQDRLNYLELLVILNSRNPLAQCDSLYENYLISGFFLKEKKRYQISTGNFKVAEELILMYSEFVEKYPIIGIIDGISFKVTTAFKYSPGQLN